MATARLSLSDKGDIQRGFRSTLNRSLNNKQFPIAKDDLFEFGIKCLPEDVGERYAWLHEHDKALTSAHSWRPDIEIVAPHPTEPDVTRTYTITTEGKLPKDPMKCPASHPQHAEVLAWAEWYSTQYDSVRHATNYIERLVDVCTTVGQIKRVLPPEVMSSIPAWMQQTLNEAIRKSRIPRPWVESKWNTPEFQENFMQTLVLGAISLEAPDISTTCRYSDTKNRK